MPKLTLAELDKRIEAILNPPPQRLRPDINLLLNRLSQRNAQSPTRMRNAPDIKGTRT